MHWSKGITANEQGMFERGEDEGFLRKGSQKKESKRQLEGGPKGGKRATQKCLHEGKTKKVREKVGVS